MSEAFRTRTKDRFEEEIEEEEEDMKSEPFEDNPMPVITANIEKLNQQAKVLIDSGASINLVTQEIADALIAKAVYRERVADSHRERRKSENQHLYQDCAWNRKQADETNLILHNEEITIRYDYRKPNTDWVESLLIMGELYSDT